MKTVEQRARIVLVAFAIAIAAQLIGIAPGLEYISGAFPTHFHKIESAILVLGLFTSLVIASFASGQSRTVALTIIGALMFYSFFKALMTINTVIPLHVRLIWTGVSFAMTGTLAWIVFRAFRLESFGWQGLFFSLALASMGFIYLKLIS